MSIWFQKFTIELLNERGKNTLSEHLGIKFVEIGDEYLKATMPVNQYTIQPIGILHGGANVVLAETIASTAANCVINIDTHFCVGLEINANHLRSVKSGLVTATTHAIHIGNKTHVWHIDIVDEHNKKSCVSRMTACVLEKTQR